MNKHTLIIFVIFTLVMAACTAQAGPNGESAMATESLSAEPGVTAFDEPETADETKQVVEAEALPAVVEGLNTVVLPLLGPAPVWGNDVWINSETPLPLEDLRGKVVLLEFWTFG